MRYLLIALLCLTSLFVCHGYAQQEEITQLLSVQNISISEVPNISTPDNFLNERNMDEGLSFQLLTKEKEEHQNSRENDTSPRVNAKKMASKKTQKFYANVVAINVLNGYTFHVADYYGPYGNSRIVTCLNGEMRGLQGIADNGVITIESTDVTWHKDYFVHRYPYGKVTSYPNSQVLEIY